MPADAFRLNAVFDETGATLRAAPFTAERVKAALARIQGAWAFGSG